MSTKSSINPYRAYIDTTKSRERFAIDKSDTGSSKKGKRFKSLTINGNKKYTRSLMIADLSKENSILLQDLGVGKGRIFGCGIFLPHKSIDAVANFKED